MNSLCEEVSLLRENKEYRRRVDKRPGIYRWWFEEEVARKLLDKAFHDAVDYSRIDVRTIGCKRYLALYFGISKDMRGRFKWHACQHHSASTVKHGTLSTLRHTLCALLGVDMSAGEGCVNSFMDTNCLWEWEYVGSQQEAEDREKKELSTVYYPLNIQNNKAVSKELIQRLKKLRKRCKK